MNGRTDSKRRELRFPTTIRCQLIVWVSVFLQATWALGADDPWKLPQNGNFNDGAMWTDGTPPGFYDTAVFDVAGTYTVSFASAGDSTGFRVVQGDVTFKNLGGGSYRADRQHASSTIGVDGALRAASSGTSGDQADIQVRSGSSLEVGGDIHVATLANRGGRCRWKIENEGFNNQKNGGFNLEHAYSIGDRENKDFYLLMQIAHIILQLIERGSLLAQPCKKLLGSLRNVAKRLAESLRFCSLADDATDLAAAARIQIRLDGL